MESTEMNWIRLLVETGLLIMLILYGVKPVARAKASVSYATLLVIASWEERRAYLTDMWSYQALAAQIAGVSMDIDSKDNLPVFYFLNDPGDTIQQLPEPLFPFGLSILLSDKEITMLSRFHHLRHLWLYEGDQPLTGYGLAFLVKLSQLRGLSLVSRRIADQDLQVLFNLETLKVLDLSETQIQGLNLSLAHWKGLEILNMQKTPLGDRGMKELSRYRSLRWLSIGSTEITDEGLKFLSRLSELRTLCLDDTRITDIGLKYLSSLRRLRFLYLRKTKITGMGLRYLSSLSELEVLNLGSTLVTDEALDYLAPFKKLRWLALDGTQITDAGLIKLSCLSTLEGVDIVNCLHITPQGMSQLQRRCPNLWIFASPGILHRLNEK
jgi:Leucine-rich repeat (LRR) protein